MNALLLLCPPLSRLPLLPTPSYSALHPAIISLDCPVLLLPFRSARFIFPFPARDPICQRSSFCPRLRPCLLSNLGPALDRLVHYRFRIFGTFFVCPEIGNLATDKSKEERPEDYCVSWRCRSCDNRDATTYYTQAKDKATPAAPS